MAKQSILTIFSTLVIMAFTIVDGIGQEVADDLPPPKKGSYLYFGQPRIEDNSMLLEEAFNQEKGFVQHISNLSWENLGEKEFLFSYSEEIPVSKDRHQLSFVLNYPANRPVKGNELAAGFGDTYLSYRTMICDKNDWALVIPRFTLIMPTGDPRRHLGDGAWGGQLGLAITKRISKKVITHYNVSYTSLINADRFIYNNMGPDAEHYRAHLKENTMGISVVYLVAKNLNLMLEAFRSSEQNISEGGSIYTGNTFMLNPGFRFAFDLGDMQIVPGFGFPLSFSKGDFQATGSFVYLSLEPDHTK